MGRSLGRCWTCGGLTSHSSNVRNEEGMDASQYQVTKTSDVDGAGPLASGILETAALSQRTNEDKTDGVLTRPLHARRGGFRSPWKGATPYEALKTLLQDLSDSKAVAASRSLSRTTNEGNDLSFQSEKASQQTALTPTEHNHRLKLFQLPPELRNQIVDYCGPEWGKKFSSTCREAFWDHSRQSLPLRTICAQPNADRLIRAIDRSEEDKAATITLAMIKQSIGSVGVQVSLRKWKKARASNHTEEPTKSFFRQLDTCEDSRLKLGVKQIAVRPKFDPIEWTASGVGQVLVDIDATQRSWTPSSQRSQQSSHLAYKSW